MKIGSLTVFQRNNRGSRLWAAWHSPHSLTWRWLVTVSRREAMPQWFAWHRQRHNTGTTAVACALWWVVRVQTQRPMWYRDLYRRAREDSDTRAYQASEAAYLDAQAEQAQVSTLH